METLAFLLLVAMQRNYTGVECVSMEVFNFRLTSNDKSQSQSHCDWRSVSQYVLVSSPIWATQNFTTIKTSWNTND
jgi:hypothetical protein